MPTERRKEINPYGYFTHVSIPEAIVKRTELTPAEKLIYGRLVKHCGRDGRCFPKQTSIAESLGLSRSIVQKSLKSLESVGLIGRVKGNPLMHQHDSYVFYDHEYLHMGENTADSGSELPEAQNLRLREPKECASNIRGNNEEVSNQTSSDHLPSSKRERREGSANPSEDEEIRRWENAMVEIAGEAAEAWAKGAGIPPSAKDVETFHAFLKDEPGIGASLPIVIRFLFEACDDPDSGWRTRYRHAPAFLKNFDRVHDFMLNYISGKRAAQAERYELLKGGYRYDLHEVLRRVSDLGGPANAVNAFLDGDERVETIPAHYFGLICPDYMLHQLPTKALLLPPNMEFAENFYAENGFEQRLNKIKEMLND